MGASVSLRQTSAVEIAAAVAGKGAACEHMIVEENIDGLLLQELVEIGSKEQLHELMEGIVAVEHQQKLLKAKKKLQ